MRVILNSRELVAYLTNIHVSDIAGCNRVISQIDEAEEVVIPTMCLAQAVQSLLLLDETNVADLLRMLRQLLVVEPRVRVAANEIEAGLKMLETGGCFTEGVKAYIGRQMASGEAVFLAELPCDAKALAKQGIPVLMPSGTMPGDEGDLWP